MNTPTQDLIDWLRSEADRHTNSVAARDVAVQQHIATLRAWAIHVAALSAPAEAKRGTDAQIAFERKLTCEAINGAIAFGYQNTNPPPSDDHWLAPFWKIGRQQAELEARVVHTPLAATGLTDAVDAARYRWLARQAVAVRNYAGGSPNWEIDWQLRGESFEGAVDAARALLATTHGDKQ